MRKEEGFHVVCGTGQKNGIWDNTKERIEKGHILDLSGLSSLLVADMEYFVEHHEEILRMVKEQIERRDHFREHPEELEDMMEEARKDK